MTLQDDITATATKWWRSLTIAFGAFLVVLGLTMEALSPILPELVPYLGKWGGWATTIIGVINILLRLRTKAPIAGTVAEPLPPLPAPFVVRSIRDRYQGKASFDTAHGEPRDQPRGYPDNAP